jgi:DNA-binding response OmpR family regulator
MEQKQSVLIIEDDSVIASLIEYRLRRDGFDTQTASDGKSALAAIQTAPAPSLVMLDRMLPHHDGLFLLKSIRERAEWREVPVIILTSMADCADEAEARALGATDYMIKPFRPAELSERVKAAIAR